MWYLFGIFFIGRRRRCMLGVCERAAQADLLSVFILFINIYWAIIGQIAVIGIGLRDKKNKRKRGKT